MAIAEGRKLPQAALLELGPEGPVRVDLGARLAGRRVVLFGLPGAFTRTCTAAHMPSMIGVHEALKAKGIDEVICVSVNDPFVMRAWGEATGAEAAGIALLSDADGSFARALGLAFDAPEAGFFGRMQRFAAVVDDGTVVTLHMEQARGVCEATSGEAILATL